MEQALQKQRLEPGKRKGIRTRCTTPASTPSVPSAMPVSGLQNQSLNSLCELNTCGIRKCISDHSSIRSFCSVQSIIVQSNNQRGG